MICGRFLKKTPSQFWTFVFCFENFSVVEIVCGANRQPKRLCLTTTKRTVASFWEMYASFSCQNMLPFHIIYPTIQRLVALYRQRSRSWHHRTSWNSTPSFHSLESTPFDGNTWIKRLMLQRNHHNRNMNTPIQRGYIMPIETIRYPMWKASNFSDVSHVQVISETYGNFRTKCFTVLCFTSAGMQSHMLLKMC